MACTLLAASSEPVSLDTIREHFPRSTPAQVQRTLRRLMQEGTLKRLACGLYTKIEAQKSLLQALR
jgi:predicted transcriptional regulator